MRTSQPRGRPRHDDVLTPAEWRVVEAVRHGMSNRTIASRQGVSLDAVKFHVANALGKLGLSTRRQLRLWTGVRRDSALTGANGRKETPMGNGLQLGAIGQIGRQVGDIEAATAFWRDVVGLPHLYTYGKLAFFDCAGARLFLEEGAGYPAQSVLYFRVDDIHAAFAALEARGAAVTSAPHMIFRHPDGLEEWMAFFDDNEGRPLAIMAQVRG
ncbi:LuxR C-terminal-related transcriptional regulator [Caulobacter sp. KR2-114]|uniref:LuxR C-terminal-related transcriptional regulator n=1 Tax=Caulobacter sp. KR2-114 TaxID=3400912 RepID=UPI003BFFCD0B